MRILPPAHPSDRLHMQIRPPSPPPPRSPIRQVAYADPRVQHTVQCQKQTLGPNQQLRSRSSHARQFLSHRHSIDGDSSGAQAPKQHPKPGDLPKTETLPLTGRPVYHIFHTCHTYRSLQRRCPEISPRSPANGGVFRNPPCVARFFQFTPNCECCRLFRGLPPRLILQGTLGSRFSGSRGVERTFSSAA